MLDPIAEVTKVFDTEGTLQLQIDDGPFVEYQQSVYGYRQLEGYRTLVDFSGRWAILESDQETSASGSIPLSQVLPPVFDIEFDRVIPPHPLATPSPWTAVYVVRDLMGVPVTELRCDHYPAVPCYMDHPDFVDGSHIFEGTELSTDRIRFTDRWPIPDDERPAGGTIVRVGP
jgi:hypothetical protein